jgi:hypothetical protein
MFGPIHRNRAEAMFGRPLHPSLIFFCIGGGIHHQTMADAAEKQFCGHRLCRRLLGFLDRV